MTPKFNSIIGTSVTGTRLGYTLPATRAAPDGRSVIATSNPPTRKLSQPQIKNLALEGGGGKGFAYLGALEALEQLGILKFETCGRGGTILSGQIEGVAGASAGAIVAFLLSIGFDSRRAREWMLTTDFKRFFDLPVEPSSVDARRAVHFWPTLGGKVEVYDTEEEAYLRRLLNNQGFRRLPLVGFLTYLVERLGPPFDLVAEHWGDYAVNMQRDMGLFHGDGARAIFNETIRQAWGRIDGSNRPTDNPTFAEHHSVFEKTLLITAANLSTGQTVLFSAQHTPDFPVADAVRISMSLPFIYKPYVIDDASAFNGHPPCGTYVDGGVWNNLPIREFDDAYDGTSLGSTLGLRLTIDAAKRVHTFKQFVERYAYFGLFGTGETQVLTKYIDQTIVLDTTGLSLLNFVPDKQAAEDARRRSLIAVYEYFGKKSPEAFDERLVEWDKKIRDAQLAAAVACGNERDPYSAGGEEKAAVTMPPRPKLNANPPLSHPSRGEDYDRILRENAAGATQMGYPGL